MALENARSKSTPSSCLRCGLKRGIVNQTTIPPRQEIALGNYDEVDIPRVEPMGFEPTPSAVQSQIQNVVVVRRCSKTPANKHILSSRLSCLFADVRVGWCTTGVLDVRVIGHVILLPGLGIAS
jgi:hypothetical protein